MSLPLIYRQGRMFKINDDLLPPSARNSSVKNALYISLYREFAGANNSDKYKHLTNQQKMQKICDFAENWLKERKYK